MEGWRDWRGGGERKEQSRTRRYGTLGLGEKLDRQNTPSSRPWGPGANDPAAASCSWANSARELGWAGPSSPMGGSID